MLVVSNVKKIRGFNLPGTTSPPRPVVEDLFFFFLVANSMEDDNLHCAFLGAVLAFYWIEQEDRPWKMSDVGASQM